MPDQPVGGRVLFLVWELDVGGLQSHWMGLIEALAEQGFEPMLLCIGSKGRTGESLSRRGFSVRSLEPRPKQWPLAIPELLSVTSEFDPDVIVTASFKAVWLGPVAGRLSRTPCFLNWHSSPGKYVGRGMQLSHRVAAALGSSAICVSRTQVAELEGHYPAVRIHVIPNGVNEPESARADQLELRDQLSLPRDQLVAVVASRLAPEKRLDRFVRAIARLQDSMPDLTGIIVGDGPLREDLEREIASLEARVQLVGYTPDASQWMRAGDVVCLTSELEASPLSLIEGMACERPFVAMSAGGIMDLAFEGAVGDVVAQGSEEEFAGALKALLLESERRRTMGTTARRMWLGHLTHDLMVERYIETLWPGGRRVARPT